MGRVAFLGFDTQRPFCLDSFGFPFRTNMRQTRLSLQNGAGPHCFFVCFFLSGLVSHLPTGLRQSFPLTRPPKRWGKHPAFGYQTLRSIAGLGPSHALKHIGLFLDGFHGRLHLSDGWWKSDESDGWTLESRSKPGKTEEEKTKNHGLT